MSKPTRPRGIDLFWTYVEKSESCWTWQGAMMPNGYGHFNSPAVRSQYPHRIAYEALVGPIPTGLVIDHLCRNRACCNPSHLEAVTERVNILRGEGACARNARKTVCAKGHPFDGTRNGQRTCSVCRAASIARQTEKRRAKRAA